MFESVLQKEYGLHLEQAQQSTVGAGSDTWFLRCAEGDFVMKFPAESAINHPDAEPELCAFLRAHDIPACDFLKNRAGRYLSQTDTGRRFTVQHRFPGVTPAWNSASEPLLMESAAMLGRIHSVLQDYPALPEGIGAGFFACMTPQRALASFRKSLEIAIQRGDDAVAADLAWRIDWTSRCPPQVFDVQRLTCRNTHGDYFISQFLCDNGHLTAVIDWTTACVHPVIWELMRSFVYAAPCCADGQIDARLLERYVNAYCQYGTLNDCDRANLYRLYEYQITVCDYYGQYYGSTAANRAIYLRQAQHATRMLENLDNR